jgi:hypothetical protein
VALFRMNRDYAGVILRDFSLKDLARTAMLPVDVHIRFAPDPFDFARGRLFASSG